MVQRFLLAAGLIVGLGMTQAHAQQGSGASISPITPSPQAAGSGAAVTRVPALGDVGTSHPLRRVPRQRRTTTAVPLSQNGSQPARAAAGGGAH